MHHPTLIIDMHEGEIRITRWVPSRWLRVPMIRFWVTLPYGSIDHTTIQRAKEFLK
jgi:hypothetical protein